MKGSRKALRYFIGAFVIVFAANISGGLTVWAQHEGHMAAPQTEQPAATEAPRVEIPPEKQQLIGVKTVKVAVRPLKKTIRTVGKVEYDESRIATVNTKIEGWVEKLYVNITGQYVKKGAPLVEIYSPELYASQQEFLNVLRWAKTQEKAKQTDQVSKMISADTENILNAARQRLRFWDISDAQIKKIEQTGKPVR
jgi:Cu(I)/Ag(I) efflux system membrane fusion protein